MGRHTKVKLEELTREQKFEIVESYKTAKDPAEQIRILAELYDATPLTIRKVLREAGIDDHENDSGTRFCLDERTTTDDETNGEQSVDVEDAPADSPDCIEDQTERSSDTEVISVSSDLFHRAEAVLALIDPDDEDAIKEKTMDLISELVGAAVYSKLYGGNRK